MAAPTNVPPRSTHTGPDEVLRRLDIAVAHKLDGLLHGEYQGLVPGHGSELGETRGYNAGDDVRRIDWNVTARFQAPHVRDTIADRELETWALVDLGPSMDFGTAYCEKRDLAVSAAAAIGFLTARTGNRFGAVLARPEGDLQVVPARGGRTHLMATLHRLVASPRYDGGQVDLGLAMERLAATARRRGLAVVVSDFLAPPDTWSRSLRRIATRHETIAIEIIDPRELSLPDVGILNVVDPGSGRTREVPTGSKRFRAKYEAAATEQRRTIAEAIRTAGVDHLVLRTDRDWLLDVVRFVADRRARVHARRSGWSAR
ncbi:DUF58 domain-containing protein [Aquihabitans sp. G128]|uniref:DUF58 domain-containing protein n=1 Tax=Aquihabitans sp. G128 TaxID=2849779 RepID=UPI001C221AE1|nr:DUF58 domain-containing protein [Aquihabitans sp. G128]QXC62631.1 DUF58 domain-containing protein [Aquihabitans sp. G128]